MRGKLAEDVAAGHIVAHAAPHTPGDAAVRVGEKRQHAHEAGLVAFLYLAEVRAHELTRGHLAHGEPHGLERLGERARPGEVGGGHDDVGGVCPLGDPALDIGGDAAKLLLPAEALEQRHALKRGGGAGHRIGVANLLLALRVEKPQREGIEIAARGKLGGGPCDRACGGGRQRHARRPLVALAELLHSLGVGEGVGALGVIGHVGARPDALGLQRLEHELAGTVERLVVVHHEVPDARARGQALGVERGEVVHTHARELAGVDGAVGGQARAREVEDGLLVLLPEEVGVVGLKRRQALAEKAEHALELLGRHARRLEVLFDEVVLERHDEPGLAAREGASPLGGKDGKLQVAGARHAHAAGLEVGHRLHGCVACDDDAHLPGWNALREQRLHAAAHERGLAGVVRALRHEEARLVVRLDRRLGGHGLQSHGSLPSVHRLGRY